MKGKLPAFQFYPDAWLSSTDISLMSPAEEGAYIRLLCHAWLQPDCGLPTSDDELATLSRLGKFWTRSRNRILAKFEVIDGRFYNLRQLEERKKLEEWQQKKSVNGSKGADARWAKYRKDTDGISGVDGRTINQPLAKNSSSSSISISIERLKTSSPAAPDEGLFGKPSSETLKTRDTPQQTENERTEAGRGDPRKPSADLDSLQATLTDFSKLESPEPQLCADATRNAPVNGKPRATAASLGTLQEKWFSEEFWPNYWRKVDKADALKAFKKHAKIECVKDQIVAAEKTHAPYYLGRNPEHRPHAATWLNKKRYEEPPEDESSPQITRGIPRRKSKTELLLESV